MTLVVHTARVNYSGPDRFDVTRATADKHQRATGERHPGEPFAPSWAILRPALALMRLGEEAEGIGDEDERARFDAAGIGREAWALYREAYTLEMRESYRRNRAAWERLLARERVVLVCFCPDATRCHRTVLAAILAALGATNAGEMDRG